MDWSLLASAYALVFLAELPGKTTFASFLMASRGRPWPVFIGAAAGFVVHTAIAVAAGGLLARLPARALHLGIGLLFLGLAVMLWREDSSGTIDQAISGETGFGRTAWTAFGVIFVAQWGDPSQLATAALAARYAAPVTVFFGATAAFWSVSGLAVLAGRFSKGRFHPRALQRLAAVVFASAGAALLVQAARG